eukprot:XP_024438500.1 probable L-gulonolactone oxidase 6 [Populus trichocarpa]
MDLSVVCLLMLVLVCHGAGNNETFQEARCKKHGPAIRFPFRLDKQPVHCGYDPRFVLSCNQRNETLLQLPTSVTLNIKKIDYASRLIIAADPDNCLPRQLRNFSLSQSPFKFAGQYQDDYALFNCTSKQGDYYDPISCLGVPGYDIYAYSSNNFLGYTDLTNCTKMYNVPSIPSEMIRGDNILHLNWSEPAACVTLQLQPLFKRSISYVVKKDTDLGDQVASFGRQHEFADITWYPSQGKAVYRIDDRISSNTSGNGLYDYIAFRSTLSLGLAAIRATEDAQESLKDPDGKCASAKLITSTLVNLAYGLTNNGIVFTGYPIIGYHNRLQSSGTCLDSPEDALITACPWDSRIKGEYFFQATFSISLSVVKSFIQDVQNLVKLEPRALCGLEQYNGILMRYVKASSAYLGKEDDALDFDMTFYRNKDPTKPRLYEDIYEEIEQLAVFKYGGLPHWGKNRNLVFNGALKKYKNAGAFLRVKEMYDPLGLFSNEWADQVLGLKGEVNIIKEGCALEGLCICSQDIHCAPRDGYLCRAGKIYQDARVCALVSNSEQ